MVPVSGVDDERQLKEAADNVGAGGDAPWPAIKGASGWRNSLTIRLPAPSPTSNDLEVSAIYGCAVAQWAAARWPAGLLALAT